MAASTPVARPHPAPIRIVGVGLGRTGTMSLRAALDILGFGPCYHLFSCLQVGRNDLALWSQASDETCETAPETFDKILRGWVSVCDNPAAINAEKLYAAYPDAKFILTTRDPEKWEKSMQDTLIRSHKLALESQTLSPIREEMKNWHSKYILEKYHHGRLWTHTQEELLKHNTYIKNLIPPEQLLVYETGEGWDRLAAFLGVPTPTVPFPHLNDTATFCEAAAKLSADSQAV